MSACHVICIGKMREEHYRKAANEYLARLRHYLKMYEQELRVSTKKHDNDTQIKRKESEALAKCIPCNAVVYTLSERGKTMTSCQFASQMQQHLLKGQDVCFLISGALGHDDILERKSNHLFSLSPMTYPHELARVMLYEQLYRAMTILKHEPYHK